MSTFDSFREHYRQRARRHLHRPDPIEGPYNARANNLIGALILLGILALIAAHLWGVT